MISVPENFKPICGIASLGTTVDITSDTISVKNAQSCYIVVQLNPVAGTGILLTPQRATAVLPTGSAVLANVVEIWANEDTATTDTLVRQTAALNFTTTADANPKIIIFKIDPANLGGVYDCVNLLTGALPVTDSISAIFWVEPRHGQAIPPTMLTD